MIKIEESKKKFPICSSLKEVFAPLRIALENRISEEGQQGWILKGYDMFYNPVAIKIFNEPLDEGGNARFLKEVEILTKMTHANILKIRTHFHFPFNGQTYFGYMADWIDGGTLADKMDILQNLGFENRLNYIIQVLDAEEFKVGKKAK